MEYQRASWIYSGDMVNRTNEKYAEAGLALIQKIPTPITPVKWIRRAARSPWPFSNRRVP